MTLLFTHFRDICSGQVLCQEFTGRRCTLPWIPTLHLVSFLIECITIYVCACMSPSLTPSLLELLPLFCRHHGRRWPHKCTYSRKLAWRLPILLKACKFVVYPPVNNIRQQSPMDWWTARLCWQVSDIFHWRGLELIEPPVDDFVICVRGFRGNSDYMFQQFCTVP